jgi:hypothetical protein
VDKGSRKKGEILFPQSLTPIFVHNFFLFLRERKSRKKRWDTRDKGKNEKKSERVLRTLNRREKAGEKVGKYHDFFIKRIKLWQKKPNEKSGK